MDSMPNTIGRYEIKSELGRGGMAAVYLAHDPTFKRDVAIKVLPPEFLNDPQFREKFQREAQNIASLEHPAIVPVYDFGEENSQLYLVMRHMTGGSLSDRLEPGALSLPEVNDLITRLAAALDAVHAKNIVHRDLKPGNILFDQYDHPYISDFGISKTANVKATSTASASTGTPAYISPEQARGDLVIDSRSDIYALGVILFELLTGKLPYEADTAMGIAIKHITEPLPNILEKNPDLPPQLQGVIDRAMAKEPRQRYATAGELASALAVVVAAATGVVPAALTVFPPQAKSKPPAGAPSADTQPIGVAVSAMLANTRVRIVGGVLLLLIALIVGALIVAPKSAVATITTSSANVRSGPGTEFAVVAAYSKSIELQIAGRNEAGTWLAITTPNDEQGWIAASVVTTTVEVGKLPVVESP